MTYFGFLTFFLGIPLVILGGLTWYDHYRRKKLAPMLQNWPASVVVLILIVIAVVYTTPWDNYLVATNVWWYDPRLVTGVVWGWVPIEEYTFFVVQTLFTGLWLLYLARHLSISPVRPPYRPKLRWSSTLAVGGIWLASVVILAIGWQAGTYLGLELVWALPPIMLQLAFGADILWHYRRLVLWVIIPTTLYLSLADTLAINAGTWTIDPVQSLNLFLWGGLPVEEFIFFLLTNTLITFGMVLGLVNESKARLPKALARVNRQLVESI